MKHIKEKWKDIIGYEGYYKVSNLGNILSLNYNRIGHPQLLSLRIGHKRNNYVDVMLTKIGLHKTNIYDAVSGKQKTCGGYIWKKAI